MKKKLFVLMNSCLILCSLSLASPVLYDDFSSGNLDKWDTTDLSPLSKASVVNEQLYFTQTASYDYTTSIITTNDISFDISGVSASSPLEMYVTMPDRTFNSSSSAYSFLIIGFMDSNGYAIKFRAGFQVEGQAEVSRVDYTDSTGTNQAGSYWYNSYFYDGDVIGMRYTGSTVELLRNGTVFRTVSGIAYGGEMSDLVAFIQFAGPNNGGTVTLDNVSFTSVPEPTTLALLGGGCMAALLRRRK